MASGEVDPRSGRRRADRATPVSEPRRFRSSPPGSPLGEGAAAVDLRIAPIVRLRRPTFNGGGAPNPRGSVGIYPAPKAGLARGTTERGPWGGCGGAPRPPDGAHPLGRGRPRSPIGGPGRGIPPIPERDGRPSRNRDLACLPSFDRPLEPLHGDADFRVRSGTLPDPRIVCRTNQEKPSIHGSIYTPIDSECSRTPCGVSLGGANIPIQDPT